MRNYLLDVIHGRRWGVKAAAVRAALSAGSIAYETLHELHRLAYRLGLARSVRLPVPVVSVGNLTAGGTGKTPLVDYLARKLAGRRLRVAVLARGYGRRPNGGDDEYMLESLGLPNVARFAAADRAAAARRAIEEFAADVLLLDDGFQHYRIRRDLEVVTVDATNPFSNGRLLPRGLLRDRPSALQRAGVVVMTRVDQAPEPELKLLRERIAKISGARPIVEAVHRPTAVRLVWNEREAPVEWVRARRLFAFCGLGNPEAFRRTLESCGARIVKFRAFPDHYFYRPLDLLKIEAEAQEFMAEGLITSEKDACKLDPAALHLPLASLRVEMELVRGEERLDALLDTLIRDRAPAEAASAR
ncbi:MAG: tetraacyldisaccharide 4'-kinase [Planctomycetes bacterium]|nr:tetraacyldisaccharide 4'-kinase [Planctomycetota bacterium]